MAKPKTGALAILALQRRPPSGGRRPPGPPPDDMDAGSDDGEGDDAEGLEDAMQDLASAVREGDPTAMAEAFRAALDIAR